MKRFNHNGFGLGAMIGFVCFFILVLIVIAVLAYKTGLSEDPFTSMILLKEEISFAYWC